MPSPLRAAGRGLGRWLLASLTTLLLLAASPAWALHFDVELRTSAGPVAGSRITTHFFGDLNVTGALPIDSETGYKIFWGYFGDLEGGPYLTDDPGFQSFGGTFLRREEVHFRAVGRLQYWDPATGRWGPAAPGTQVALFGGIPVAVIVGYTENPTLWQAQYDYWAAGTRFTAQGIDGPPAAVIDDAGSTGAFHAHLDWKITAAGGAAPAAGAYLVTLELFSTALHNGSAKYVPAPPIHIVFERGISEAQLQAAIQARVTPPPPPRCGATTLAWVVANTGCSAAVDETASGSSVTARDLTPPAIGSANFSCSAGQWSSASQASCAVPPPPVCPSQLQTWTVGAQQCSGVTPETVSGGVQTATDAEPPAIGSARFACNNGAWSAATTATCAVPPPPPPPPCAAAVLGWTVAGNTCQAAALVAASGSSVVLTDNTEPHLGSASFVCTAGTWGAPTQATCSAAPAPRPCTAQTLGWSVAGSQCSASAATTASGSSVTVADSDGPLVGTAVFACGNGSWGAAQSASCAAVPVAGCGAAVLPWTQGNQSCSAAVPATPAGGVVLALDGDAPHTGSATFSCTAGRWSDAQQPVCTAPPPPPPPPPQPCAAQPLSWTQAGLQCTASASTLDSGLSLLLSDTLAPTLGSASFVCNNGTWSSPTAATCSVAPPRDCPAQPLTWSVGAHTCQASAAAAPSGRSLALLDVLAPTYGSARFVCSDGSWLPSAPATALCGTLSQTPLRTQPRSPWRPPPALPWQGP